MNSSNPRLGTELQMIRGYGAAALSVLVALLISHWPFLHLESAPVSLFLCAVIFSAWLGGIGYRPFGFRFLLQLPASS